MKAIPLAAEKRTIIGRKVKQLRAQKLVPGNVFGKDTGSIAVQIADEAFAKVYAEAGETGLVELALDGQKRPVLIKLVQVHPVKNTLLHVDFHQVDLKEKVTANVPLELKGTAPAVAGNLGILLELTDDVEVEALPTDLPEHIVVDLSKLVALDDTIFVKDLQLPAGVTIVTDGETEVVKIGELVTKEAEADATAEAAAQAEAQPDADAAAPAASASAKEAPAVEKTEEK